MANELIPQYLDIWLLIAGVSLWLASPLFERAAGEQATVGALLGGTVALASAALVAVFLTLNPAFAWTATAFLCWGALVYGAFWLMPEEPAPKDLSLADHCKPKLIFGESHFLMDHKWTLRTRLTAKFEVKPSDCRLAVSAWAYGRVFYGLFYTGRPLALTPTVDIVCSTVKGGGCKALAYVSAATLRAESPVQLQVQHDIKEDDDEVTVRTTMTASVGASGGSIGASAAGFGGSIGLTSAGLTFQQAMGMFRWRCEAG
jgi:hypothetical protein